MKTIINKKNLTLPNLLSIFRIILIIPFVRYMIKEYFLESGFILFFSAFTDFLDGFLARSLNQESDFGKMLDPVADKFTILSVMVCISFKLKKIIPFMIILIIKEIIMLIVGAWLIKINKKPIKARWYGKLGTAFFYFSIFIIVSFKALWNIENKFLINFLMLITSLLMFYALIRYFFDFIKIKKDTNDLMFLGGQNRK